MTAGSRRLGAGAATFFMYEGPTFPSPASLMACRNILRMQPLDAPMAQFYSEIGLHQVLSVHPSRVYDPERADLFYVPVLPHLDSDAGRCNGTGHKARMAQVVKVLQASPHWRRRNGTDHVWACSCVMMKGMMTNMLWDMLGSAVHAVHSVPRRRASPSGCQLAVPYLNPTFARPPASVREPGLARPTLAHFRGRVMNRVRSALVKRYGTAPGAGIIQAAHASTAARCNVNKCKRRSMDEHGFSPERHFEEMRSATFCLVPRGDSPPSSRLYLAVAAGCIPVFLSDDFEGAFAPVVPWPSFSLRFAEAELQDKSFNLTSRLLAVATDRPRLLQMQASLRDHAADVLYELPDSRVGSHFLRQAWLAIQSVCSGELSTNSAPGITWESAKGLDRKR